MSLGSLRDAITSGRCPVEQDYGVLYAGLDGCVPMGDTPVDLVPGACLFDYSLILKVQLPTFVVSQK